MTSIGLLAAAKRPRAVASDPCSKFGLRNCVGNLAMGIVRRLELWSAALLLFSLTGCCKPFDSATRQENDAAGQWVTESWRGQYDWMRIPQWRPVLESGILRADTILKSVSVVRITKEEAGNLVGESNLAEGAETPYLLRAVADAKGVFPLELDVRPDGSVWAGGGANSKCPVGMRRRPVVVWLSRAPDKLYVTFYVNRD